MEGNSLQCDSFIIDHQRIALTKRAEAKAGANNILQLHLVVIEPDDCGVESW